MKPEVIYILGVGHSGSTLLSLLLGTASNAVSVGELRYLNNYLRKISYWDVKHMRYVCDCGEDLQACAFWGPITKDLQLGSDVVYDSGSLGKLRTVLHIYFPWVRPDYIRLDDKRLYKAIARVSKTQLIIDSSKDLGRLMYLYENVGLPVKVIHLVRDARGVVASHEKMRYNWLVAVANWFFGNWFMRAYCRRRVRQNDYVLISYERFCERPGAYLQLLRRRLGVNVPTQDYLSLMNRTEYHHFAGNALRNKTTESIKMDASWRQQMPVWKRGIVTVLTALPNRFWVKPDTKTLDST